MESPLGRPVDYVLEGNVLDDLEQIAEQQGTTPQALVARLVSAELIEARRAGELPSRITDAPRRPRPDREQGRVLVSALVADVITRYVRACRARGELD